MEGKQLSTSRAVAIYVRDVLSRYDPDPLRYYLAAAGPETHDTDFTWSEFVRRNNDELVATWGNLVNRTLTSAYRNFGEVPAPGPLADADRALLDAAPARLETVGTLIESSRFRAALGEAMAFARDANQYLSEQAPWALLRSDRDRAATVLNVALRTVDTLKLLMTPFLPHTSQRLHELLGYETTLSGPLAFREHADDGGDSHTVLTGDYETWATGWHPSTLAAGQRLLEPAPLFKKLDAGLADEELERMRAEA
jgi:methionyl-tRNA synthetase